MLVSPKWQTMWMESQSCSKGIVNVPLNSQQSNKILEDVKENCNSPNKTVQLEALKCWGIWINNQNPNDWKLNTLCYPAIRPLIATKLQPLHKDVDVCKLKLSLMWSLILKVENIMYLEGPQYILEVFLQSCLTWLSSIDTVDNETSVLIFQLVLALFKKDKDLKDCDREMFPALSVEILSCKKVFQTFADKLLNIFINWKKVKDKSTVFKIWKYFLEYCANSRDNIPTPIWHKIFKNIGQICSESNESIKHRLAFLHSCSTSLKTVLCSSKFIDFGNLLTPCEVLLKKLLELCQLRCEEFCDSEMFFLSQEICQVLTEESISIGGYDLCISVLDLLEEFSIRSLFWGVWCGLVHCYKVCLLGVNKNNLTKMQMKFYRKLRGVAVNYELDKEFLHKDCMKEVEKNIEVLNIKCFCTCVSENVKYSENSTGRKTNSERIKVNIENQDENSDLNDKIVSLVPKKPSEVYLPLPWKNLIQRIIPRIISLRYDLLKDVLKAANFYSVKDLIEDLFQFRFQNENKINRIVTNNLTLQIDVLVGEKKIILTDCNSNKPLAICDVPFTKDEKVNRKRFKVVDTSEVVSTPKTRSKKRAEEEEEFKKKIESKKRTRSDVSKEGSEVDLNEGRKRRRNKSFEVIVQEIVRKNKLRKTEKNKETEKRKIQKLNEKENAEVFKRKLRNSKEEKVKSKGKTDGKTKKVSTNGKLENYFKVITKKPVNESKDFPCKVEKEIKIDKKTKKQPTKKVENKKTERKEKAKLSPFKEVSHDHEYAKAKPSKRMGLGKVFTESFQKKQKKLKILSEVNETMKKGKNTRTEEKILSEPKEKETVAEISICPKQEELRSEPTTSAKDLCEIKEEFDTPNNDTLEEKVIEGMDVEKINVNISSTPDVEEHKPDVIEFVKEKKDCLETQNDLNENETKIDKVEDVRKISQIETQVKRGLKRRRIMDSLKPSKRIKLDISEELQPGIDVIEKENVENRLEEIKVEAEETTATTVTMEGLAGDKVMQSKVKDDASLKSLNGSVSSRALRMIALVPESTKLGAVHRECSSKVENLKLKKAPNVDKSSRASKMLALLSENTVKDEDDPMVLDEEKSEDVVSIGSKLQTTPVSTTPISKLKSFSSVKKRRSIRFDDAKNETVLYKTDTPPSQIHEEKEKFRRIYFVKKKNCMNDSLN